MHILQERKRTTLIIRRGTLMCYMCLRNLVVPFVKHDKYTVWADHGTLWKRE